MHEKGELQFEELVEAYYAPLFRFAYSLTHAESSACDLVQETFVVWAQKGHQLQDASKVKTWLFTTLHRRFLQDKRRETRFVHVELGGAESELPVLQPELVSRLDSHLVVKMLGQVNPQFQAPVALVLFGGIFLQRNRRGAGSCRWELSNRASPVGLRELRNIVC